MFICILKVTYLEAIIEENTLQTLKSNLLDKVLVNSWIFPKKVLMP